MSAGLWHTCAARSDGVVVCTGNNWDGQINVPATLNLLKHTQPIVFTPAVPNPAVLGKLFKPVPNVGSGNPVVFNSLTPAVCLFTADPQPYVWFTAEGTCSFSADRAGNDQYEPSPQLIVTVTVAMGTQTITFTSSAPNPGYIGDTYTVTATGGDSFNPVTFSSLTTATCTVAGSTVSFVAVGACTVAADQAGSASYQAAAQQVTQAITVARRPQTITFTLPATGVMGSPLTVSATGGASGNALTFTVLTPSACTLNGNSLSLTNIGQCTVAADQAGNSVYDAAPRVTATVAVRWPFTGFVGLLAPPSVNGSIKAGSTVNVTFSLGGNRGMSVLAGSPTVQAYTCNSTLPPPGAGSPNAGTLAYNATTQQYTYNFVTLKSRASKTCVQFSLSLADGSIHTALFQFK